MTVVEELLRQHVSQLLIGEADLVNGLSSVLEGNVVAVEVGREKYFCWLYSAVSGCGRGKSGIRLGHCTRVPVEALGGGEVCNLRNGQ